MPENETDLARMRRQAAATALKAHGLQHGAAVAGELSDDPDEATRQAESWLEGQENLGEVQPYRDLSQVQTAQSFNPEGGDTLEGARALHRQARAETRQEYDRSREHRDTWGGVSPELYTRIMENTDGHPPELHQALRMLLDDPTEYGSNMSGVRRAGPFMALKNSPALLPLLHPAAQEIVRSSSRTREWRDDASGASLDALRAEREFESAAGPPSPRFEKVRTE